MRAHRTIALQGASLSTVVGALAVPAICGQTQQGLANSARASGTRVVQHGLLCDVVLGALTCIILGLLPHVFLDNAQFVAA